jgi:drug/metabolite transporter (DMT)-like permease
MEEAIPIVAITMAASTACTAIVVKHLRRVAEEKHLQRMHEIELGIPAASAGVWPALSCIAVGACVPIASVLFGFLSVLQQPSGNPWPAVAMVGLSGVICGSKMATKLNCRVPTKAGSKPSRSYQDAAFDPDAYDVAGRRG